MTTAPPDEKRLLNSANPQSFLEGRKEARTALDAPSFRFVLFVILLTFAACLCVSFWIHSTCSWKYSSSLLTLTAGAISAGSLLSGLFEHYAVGFRTSNSKKTRKPIPPILKVLGNLGFLFLLLLAIGPKLPSLGNLPTLIEGWWLTVVIAIIVVVSCFALPRWLVIPPTTSRKATFHLRRALRAWFGADEAHASGGCPQSPVGSRSYRILILVRTVFFLTVSFAPLTSYAPLAPLAYSKSAWSDLVLAHPHSHSESVSEDPEMRRTIRAQLGQYSLEQIQNWEHRDSAGAPYPYSVYTTANEQLRQVKTTPTGWLAASIEMARTNCELAFISWLASFVTLGLCILGGLGVAAFWCFVDECGRDDRLPAA